MDEPLKVIETLLIAALGALSEGDKFAVLKWCQFIIRAFEFALADGGLDCTKTYSIDTSYADRFWDADTRQYGPNASKFALFDIKSTASGQGYLGSIAQRNRIAFFLGVDVGDPSYVDLIPNFFQQASTLDSEVGSDEKRKCLVTHHTISRMPASSYGMIGLETTPYRMPLHLLPQAIERVRAHVRGEAVYVNPSTETSFSFWNPAIARHTDHLKPMEKGQLSACEAALEIYRNLTVRKLPIRLDFVGLQPRIADMKMVYESPLRQYFIQHKLEGRIRSSHSLLKDVPIARGEGDDRKHYFTSHNREDFLFYQFEFSQHPNPRPRIEFVFCPEKAIPNEYYTTTNRFADFEIDAFTAGESKPGRRGYRIIMDEDSEWVQHILDIIAENPQPRLPDRPTRKGKDASVDDDMGELPTTLLGDADSPRQPTTVKAGRREYEELMIQRHREFFYRIMHRCARRRRGLLIIFSRNNALGDFGYCDYEWTDEDAHMFERYFRPPQFLHTLPPTAPFVSVTYYVRYMESAYQGSNLTASEYRRINATDAPRLLIWDLAGPDTQPLLCVLPSVDVTATEAQRALFDGNLQRTSEDWKAKTPTVSALLNTGLNPSDYMVDSGMPTDETDWERLLVLLDRFLGMDSFEHPPHHLRLPERYHHTIGDLNQQLALQHSNSAWPDERS